MSTASLRKRAGTGVLPQPQTDVEAGVDARRQVAEQLPEDLREARAKWFLFDDDSSYGAKDCPACRGEQWLPFPDACPLCCGFGVVPTVIARWYVRRLLRAVADTDTPRRRRQRVVERRTQSLTNVSDLETGYTQGTVVRWLRNGLIPAVCERHQPCTPWLLLPHEVELVHRVAEWRDAGRTQEEIRSMVRQTLKRKGQA